MIPADTPRPDTTGPDTEYSLSIDETADRYAEAGHPRTTRSVQRYCARGHLDCHKKETPFGDVYRVAPYSIGRHIAQIEELAQATSRDVSRLIATDVAVNLSADTPRPDSSTDRDASRPDTTSVTGTVEPISCDSERADTPDQSRQDATVSRYVEHLEETNDFLRDQIIAKDKQIGDLTERARETNHLIGGLQRMLTPLLGSSRDHERQSGAGDNRTGDHSATL